MAVEVCYDRMRPRQIVAAREAFPAAYLPIGTLEWHGHHNPVGCDGLLSHALAVRCAQAGGGVVFPPLYYGESREEGLMEVNPAVSDTIAAEMKLPISNFAPGYMRQSVQQQYENYQRLLLHCLYEIQSLGFKVAVFSAGHYPLLDHARAACSLFHQSRWNNKRAQMITWAFTGHELVQDVLPSSGDHGGYWETSLALALVPGLSDLNELPKDRNVAPKAILTQQPVQDANAEYGEKAIQLMVDRVVQQVRDRVINPKAYYDHGVRL